jgi:hypothetical protein
VFTSPAVVVFTLGRTVKRHLRKHAEGKNYEFSPLLVFHLSKKVACRCVVFSTHNSCGSNVPSNFKPSLSIKIVGLAFFAFVGVSFEQKSGVPLCGVFHPQLVRQQRPK